MSIKANVTISKSFDNGKKFNKDWTFGDFKEFFEDEGEYLDKLAKITAIQGHEDEGFTVTYTVTVTKEK